MPGEIELAAAVACIINKMIPNRKEAAMNELFALENLLARALKESEATICAQIRKRMKQIRLKYPDID